MCSKQKGGWFTSVHRSRTNVVYMLSNDAECKSVGHDRARGCSDCQSQTGQVNTQKPKLGHVVQPEHELC